jgi:DHA1 family bicyclomycin/chloramphenicol resistance-like MFS transporter
VVLQVFVGTIFYLGIRDHLVDLRATLVLFFVFLSCIGLTYPNAAAVGLAPFSRDAGRASALLGFLQTGTGALVSMGIGLLGVRAIVSLLSLTALAALAIYLVGRTRIKETIENTEAEAVLTH